MSRVRSFLTSILFIVVLSNPSALFAQIWTPVPEIGRDVVYALLAHRGVLHAATGAVIYRSTDSGKTWALPIAYPKTDTPPEYTSFLAAGDLLFAGTVYDGVYRSEDRGETWTRFGAGHPDRVAGLALRGDSIYAITDDAGIHVRDIGGQHAWNSYNEGLGWMGGALITTFEDRLVATLSEFTFVRGPGDNAWRSLPWDAEGNQKFASAMHVHGSLLFAGTATGVKRWNGTDPTWQQLDVSPAPNRRAKALTSVGDRVFAVLQPNPARHLIVASDDEGERWTIIDDTQGEVLAFTAEHGMFWSARADGLWYRPLDAPSGLAPLPGSVEVRLEPPYPQPASSIASLQFHLERGQRVTLRVHDALGRVVRSLADGSQYSPGTHHLAVDLTGLAPGWYAVRLETPSGVRLQPLLHY